MDERLESPAEARLVCRLAETEAELAAHFAVRRQVFVEEQQLFVGDERDERDDDSGTLHVIGVVDGRPCGAVRLYPLSEDASLWQGDRLAVTPEHRTAQLGMELVFFAVRTAAALDGSRMIAHVQRANVPFFVRLGWSREGEPEQFHGAPHQLMAIDLTSQRTA